MFNRILFLSGVGMLAIGCTNLHAESEEKITLASAPAAVQAAVQKAIGTNKLEELTKDDEDGKIVYEATYKVGEETHEVSVDASGAVIKDEKKTGEKDDDDKNEEKEEKGEHGEKDGKNEK